VDQAKRIYSFESAYDPEKDVLAEIDGKLNPDGQFNGNVTIKMFSHTRTRDHYTFANLTDPDLPEFMLYEQVQFEPILILMSQ